MSVILNASTSSGLVLTPDTSGQIELQSNGTTELTVTSTGVSIADTLSFNSGFGYSATAYGCRAWVNFNGTGTVSIRASGNVGSITDNGTGDYTLNFATSLSDVNYACAGVVERRSGVFTGGFGVEATPTTASNCRINSVAGGTPADMAIIQVAIFR
jgi:hypothetical protein